MTKVKICGLTREQDIDAVNDSRPDWAGFVFTRSPRQLLPGTARRLVSRLDGQIQPVGVFVDEAAEDVAELARYCGLKAVQLHGRESGDYVVRLRKLLPAGVQVIKAVPVRDASSLETAAAADCDLLLLDAHDGRRSGGTGKAFDWRLLASFERPYLLAGGLHLDNVAEAIGLLWPYGVDVSSGVETDGAKDGEKIGQFIALARRQDK